ncbi:hypothetical protein G7Y79_00009g025700 [Physcia stellaris]|nr:hypothetical protein G7Y79_00009g025700 [Physcia stellaris]
MEDQAMDTFMDTSTTPPPAPAPAPDSTSQPLASEEQPPATIPETTSVPSQAQPNPRPAERPYTKRLLPDSLSSPYPHGLITGEARTEEQQAALDVRKSEILSTMTNDQIELRYQATAKKVQDLLQEIKAGNEKIEKEVENAKKTREMERRAWLGMKKAAADGEI